MQPGTTRRRYIPPQYSDVPSAIEIGIAAPAACRMGTSKPFAVSCSHVQAGMAHLRGIRGGNEMHHHPSLFSLIRHEDPELVEGPTVPASAFHFLAGLLIGPLPDAGQILQRNGAAGLQGIRHQLFADCMVRLALKPSFTPRQPCQKLTTAPSCTSGALRGFLLECGPQPTIAITPSRQLLPTPVLIITGVGNVSTPEIDAQDISRLSGHSGSALHLDMQEEGAIPALDQGGTRGRLALQPLLLLLPQDRFQALPTVEQRQTQGPVPRTKTADALVVVHRRRSKRGVGGALDFQRCADTRNRPDGQISGQPKLRPHINIAGMLELHLVRGVLPPRHVSNPVAGIGKGKQRGIKLRALLWGRSEFAGDRAYGVHGGYDITREHHPSTSAKASQAVPPLPVKR